MKFQSDMQSYKNTALPCKSDLEIHKNTKSNFGDFNYLRRYNNFNILLNTIF